MTLLKYLPAFTQNKIHSQEGFIRQLGEEGWKSAGAEKLQEISQVAEDDTGKPIKLGQNAEEMTQN